MLVGADAPLFHMEAKSSEVPSRHPDVDSWPPRDNREGAPDAEVAELDDEDEEENSLAAPTLTTSGYMTNSSLSSCFGEMRASNTQDSLGQQLRTQHRWEAGLVQLGADGDADDEESGEAAISERQQWRVLEQRLAELVKADAAAEELRRRRHPRRHRAPRREESERERVLRALSSCCSEDENRLDSAAAATMTAAAAVETAAAFGGLGMELCFRNDAASDDEEEAEAEADAGFASTSDIGQQQQQWQRFRRTPKNFVPSVATELTRPMQLCFISDPASSDEEDATAEEPVISPPTQASPQPPARPSRRPLEPELLASLGLAPPPAVSGSVSSACDNSAADSASDETATTAAAANVDGGLGCLRRRQAELQAEAQLALAQAEPMARMQLEVERHDRDRRCRDALAELLGVAPSRRLGRACLSQMSLGALQLAHNSLLARIESLNSELVGCLIERDDLHMEQDAMLVEIEDLTRRAHEADSVGAAKTAAAADAGGSNATTGRGASTPVRRRVSLLTARLRPDKLVSLFTGT